MIRRFVTLAAALLAASACHFGANAEERDPGSPVSRDYQLAAFDKIEVSGPYDVTVTTGGASGARASGGGALLDDTEVVVENGTLKIRAKKKNGMRFNWGRKGKATFTVTTAMLRGAGIAGSGAIAVDKVDGDFDGSIAGSGNLQLAAVRGGAVRFDIAGSGKIDAAGTAQSSKVGISGSGTIDTAGLAVRTADVSIAGSGNIKANASETAAVSIVGSGNVAISGGAKCSIDKVGGGNVTCG